MSLDYEIIKPKDLTRINTNEFGEVMWWCYILFVSPERLLTTIDKTGNSTAEVKKALSL